MLKAFGVLKKYTFLEWGAIFYTVDMFLPLIHLDERHYTEVEGGVKHYFYFLKVMGYIVGPAGIAGLLALH
jgi:hypothetical protein